MQQTDKYKLNKPGVDDPIAIAPLNENADKIEAALLAKADAALEQRVTVLEGKHIVLVVYTGDGTQNRVINPGFTPTGVIYFNAHNNSINFLSPDDTPGTVPGIVEGGVLVPNSMVNYQYNAAGRQYRMILFN